MAETVEDAPRSSKVPTAHHQPSGTEFAEGAWTYESWTYELAVNAPRNRVAALTALTLETPGLALGGASVDVFGDDDGNTHEACNNQLAALDVVAGDGAGSFDPDGVTTRGDMAAPVTAA